MHRVTQIRHFLALNASMAAMLVMVVCVGTGEKMGERFLPLYLLALGGSALSVGFLNALDNLLGALYAFPGGYLSDRLGYKRALLVFNLIALLGYAIVIVIPRWWAVLVGSVFFISWTAISMPAIMSLLSAAVPQHKRTMGVSLHSLVRRIPMALGPIVGGVLIQRYGKVEGMRIAFGAAFALGVAAMVLEWLWIGGEAPPRKDLPGVRSMLKRFGPELRNLLVSDILIRFAEQMPYAFVVVWAVNRNQVQPVQFGVLTAIEMATAMLVYIPVAYLADRSAKKPFVLLTFVFFTLFPFALPYTRTFAAMVPVFVLRGLKEFGEPTRKALIMDLAPDGMKAATFGTYYLIRDVVVSIGAFVGAFLWNISPQTNFNAAALCGLAGTLYFAAFGKDRRAR